MNTTIKRAAATAAGIASALALTGCGAIVEQVAEEAVEQAVESEGGGDVEIDFDSDDGSISVTGEDGEEFSIDVDEDGESSVMSGTDADGNTFEMTSGQGLPDEWPDELPLPGGEPIASSVLTENDQQIINVTYEISDGAEAAERLVAEYESRGFTTDSTSNFESDGSAQSFTTMSNDSWTVQITGFTDASSGSLSVGAQTKTE